MAEEYSWAHRLLEEMAFLGCQFKVISAQRAWAPRGGKMYPKRESYDGIEYFRMYPDITTFKAKLKEDIFQIWSEVLNEEKFDAVWTFHQANWYIGTDIAKKIGAKHILVCEQAFRTSGYAAGAITDRWKEIQSTTDLIISWAPQDKYNEKAIGVKYLPFGGCFRDIELQSIGFGKKKMAPMGIYQGSINPDFKNEEAMYGDICWLLEERVVEKFVVNGYPSGPSSEAILKRLKARYGRRFHHEMLIGRVAVIESLSPALIGYSPMKPAILSNFPYEAFGAGVPMYMPYIENAEDYIITNREKLIEITQDERKYELIRNKAKNYYDATHSIEMMGDAYYQEVERIVA
jgi:hypothetical protein